MTTRKPGDWSTKKRDQAPRGVRRHPSGVWGIRFTCGAGHLHKEKVGPLKSDAIRAYHARRARAHAEPGWCPEAERRAERARGAARPTLLKGLLALVVADYERNGRRTVQQIHEQSRHLLDYFGATAAAADVTGGRIEAYASCRLGERAAPATINRELSLLRRAFRLGRRAGQVPEVPAVVLLAERNVRTGFFEREQFEAVRAQLATPLRPVVTFLYLTGWRLGEVQPLEWPQVDFRAGMVRLEPGTTKNDEARTFPFGVLPELEACLRGQRELTAAIERQTSRIIPWVFHRHGQPILDFRNAWLGACERAGLAGRIPHDFRRTAVRNLERAGVSRSVAMKLTGHKTESVYRRYAIVAEADLAEGVRKLAALGAADAASSRVVPLRAAAELSRNYPGAAAEGGETGQSAG